MKCVVAVLTVVALFLGGGLLAGCSHLGSRAGEPAATVTAGRSGDAVFARAFADHASGLEVEGAGEVLRLLADDDQGGRHQRFIVELASGQTLLIAHNIDVAPRVGGLRVGDPVAFKGQYEWNDEGGAVHWTHHDPDGRHVAGWIEHRGKIYQ